MILLGDIGNTDIKISLYSNYKKLILKRRINPLLLNLNKLNFHFSFLKKYLKSIDKILFCSVVPNKFIKIKKYFELKKLKIEKLIKIKVKKNQVGSDRLANAISVLETNKNFIIIDFGTATTFDIVINKNYIGGVIAPGVQLSLDNLTNRASLIPKINLKKIKNVIGKNTSSAIYSGFYLGYNGLIDNIIKLIIKQTRKKFMIVLTGGLSHLFKNSINGKVKLDKDLTINGLLKASDLIK
jgi:type III pantothenate kinase